MEWSRACFKSKWRLFRGSSRLRAGYYYFAAHGTPHYPHVHNLGSRDWVSDNGYEDAPLGEWAGSRGKYRGDPPDIIPMAVLVGDADRIENGEDPTLPGEADSCARGGKFYPAACYSPIAILEANTNVWDCGFGYRMAKILKLQYDDIAAAQTALEAFFGGTAVITYFPQVGATVPDTLIARVQNLCLVMVTGTTSFQQLALQTMSFGLGPINQGFYSASAVYQHAANVIGTRMSSVGGGDSTRYLLIGHSYGAAVCHVLAGMIRLANPAKRIELVTYGCPKPGDERLTALNKTMKQLNWVNEGDPIPFLPPRGTTFFELLPFVPDVLLRQWTRYERVEYITVIKTDDTIDHSNLIAVKESVLKTASILIAAGLDPEPFLRHKMSFYRDRLRTICQHTCEDPEVPVDHHAPATSYHVTLTSLHIAALGRTFDGDAEVDVEDSSSSVWTWFGTSAVDTATIETLVPLTDDPYPATLNFLKSQLIGSYTGGFTIDLPDGWWEGITLVAPVLTLYDGLTDYATVDEITITPNP